MRANCGSGLPLRHVLRCGTDIGLAHTEFTDATCGGSIPLKPMKLAGRVRVSARRTNSRSPRLAHVRTNGGWPPPDLATRSSGLTRRRCANQGASLRPSGDAIHPPSRMRKTRNDPNRLYHGTSPPFPGKGKTRFAVWERRAGRMTLFWFSPKRLNHFADSDLDFDSRLWISVTGRRSPMLKKNLFFIFRGQSSEQFCDDVA
jgi:hypothetical protein